MMEDPLNQVRLMMDSKSSKASCIWFLVRDLVSAWMCREGDASCGIAYRRFVFHQTLIVPAQRRHEH